VIAAGAGAAVLVIIIVMVIVVLVARARTVPRRTVQVHHVVLILLYFYDAWPGIAYAACCQLVLG
jgi:hypothetical protein